MSSSRWGGVLYAAIPKPLTDDPAWRRFRDELRVTLQEILASFIAGTAELRAAINRMSEAFSVAAASFARLAEPLRDMQAK